MVRATYPDIKWIISDDSPMPSEHFLSRKEAIIRYSHSPVAMSIGEKRNRMTEIAAGDFIVHFDDDDFYAANYVEHMVAGIRQGYDMVKLSGWFLYSGVYRTLGYWDCHRTKGPHYVWSKEPQVFKMVNDREAEEFKHYYLGYGFSYAYQEAGLGERPLSRSGLERRWAVCHPRQRTIQTGLFSRYVRPMPACAPQAKYVPLFPAIRAAGVLS